jgi:hypothetical protein
MRGPARSDPRRARIGAYRARRMQAGAAAAAARARAAARPRGGTHGTLAAPIRKTVVPCLFHIVHEGTTVLLSKEATVCMS